MFTKALQILLGVLIGYIGGMQAISRAGDLQFEVGGGFTKYGLREDGVWWQSNSQLKTDNTMNSFGYQLGMRWRQLDSLGWRLAFVNLGHFKADNEFVGDGNTTHYPFQCPTIPTDCKMEGTIHGGAYGLSLGPVLSRMVSGFEVTAEGGGFLFRSNQRTDVRPIEPGGWLDHEFSYNRMYGMHRTWYVGVGVGRGPWSLNYRIYNDVFEQGDTSGGKGGDAGITGGNTHTLFLNYAFQ